MDPISAIANLINSGLSKWIPDANEREKVALAIATQAHTEVIAQIEVNKVEAASANLFVSGWRPACGWIGAFGLGYAAILEPMIRLIAIAGFGYAGAFPVLDTNITMQILFGILGLGAYRSYEKTKNGK